MGGVKGQKSGGRLLLTLPRLIFQVKDYVESPVVGQGETYSWNFNFNFMGPGKGSDTSGIL